MTDAPASPFATVPRALLAAVIGMGVLIVVGMAVIVGVVIHRASVRASVRHAPIAQSVTASPVLTLPLAPGEHAVSATARADGTLAVVLDGSGQARILIWDPAAQRIVSTLDLELSPPATR